MAGPRLKIHKIVSCWPDPSHPVLVVKTTRFLIEAIPNIHYTLCIKVVIIIIQRILFTWVSGGKSLEYKSSLVSIYCITGQQINLYYKQLLKTRRNCIKWYEMCKENIRWHRVSTNKIHYHIIASSADIEQSLGLKRFFFIN